MVQCGLLVVVIRTFGKLSSPSELYDKCRSLSESLANDLREERLVVSNAAVVLSIAQRATLADEK